MKDPNISVVVPLYNKARYIRRAVQSVLAQTIHDFELLIVDDGSTDEGLSLIADLADDERIVVISQSNAGEGAARNRGLAEMRGDIAAFLDADDEWLPNHLADIAELAIRFPQAGWFATGYRSVFRGGFMTETTLCSRQPVLVPDYFKIATGVYFVHISSAAVRKGVLDHTGEFRAREPVGADLEFYGRLALRHTLAYHPAISGVYYHQVPHSAMSVGRWQCERPPVVRTLDADEQAHRSPALHHSVCRYSNWVLSQYVLAGLCAGYGRKAVQLLDGRRASNRWLLTLAAHIVPSPILNLVVRLRRSRWFVRNEKRHGQVIVRRIRPLAAHG